MKPYWLVALAACGGGGESPGIVTRNPSIAVNDAVVPISEASPQGARHSVIQIVLQSEVCAPIQGFGGTFRGAAMTVVTPGSSSPGELGGCEQPTLEIDPLDVTPSGNTIEAFDDTGSVSVTFPDGELDARTMTAPSFDLKNGQAFTIAWSNPNDFSGGSPQLDLREVFEGPCTSGDCFGSETVVGGSVIDATHVQFFPSVGATVSSGEIVVTMGFPESGQVTDCDAKGCQFMFQHAAVHAATASP